MHNLQAGTRPVHGGLSIKKESERNEEIDGGKMGFNAVDITIKSLHAWQYKTSEMQH